MYDWFYWRLMASWTNCILSDKKIIKNEDLCASSFFIFYIYYSRKKVNMKVYKKVKIIPNYKNLNQYLLMLETDGEHMDEIYPITGKEEATKAYRDAKWLIKHSYVKQEFLTFNRMDKFEKKVIKGLVKTMYGITKIEEYVFG